jgi:hypothetical protein
MSYVTSTTVSAGDYGFDLQFFVLDEDNNPVDLTGASITVVFEKRGSTSASITKTGTITDATGGKFKVTIASGDFSEVGAVYDVKARIQYANGRVTAKGVVIIVEE